MMRWLMIAGGVVVAAAVVVLIVGVLRPSGHVAATSAEYAAPPEEVWSAVADWERWSEWQPEIRSVERVDDRNGHTALMTSGSWGDMPLEIVTSESRRLFVTEIDGGAFRGRWTYELAPSERGTQLTITEEGEVSNPFFRALMIFHDNYATMFDYHRALGARLGVEVIGETVVERDVEGQEANGGQ